MKLTAILRGLTFGGLLLGAAGSGAHAQGASSGAVTPEQIHRELAILSDDSMLGRGTGMPGSMKAAKFIAEQFRLAGLTPAGDSGYFQHVPMATRMLDPKSTIVVDGTVLHPAIDFSMTAGRVNPRSLDGVEVIYGGIRGDTANPLTADQVRGRLVIFSSGAAGGGGRGGRAGAGGGGGRGGGGGGGGAGGGGGRGGGQPPRSCRDTSTLAATGVNGASGAGSGGGRGGGAAAGGGGRGGGAGAGGRGGAADPLAEAAGIATIEGEQLSPRTVWTAKHPSNAFTKDPSAPAPGPTVAPPATLSITTHAAEVLLGGPLANATKGVAHKSIHSTAAILELPAPGGNVIGFIEGTDPVLKNEVVVIDAHYDHLGIGMPALGSTDSIYNGADDDGSGTISIIEIARVIKAGPPPKRTLIFMAATGEEVGLLGTNWYIAHPVRPLSQMVANLEIEMMDRPDSLSGGQGKAWMTGYERTTMGETFAAAGVPVVQDPRPSQNFFGRSDNIAYARMGIPAHTLSSFDLHSDYHQPNDEIGLADFVHMAKVINGAVIGVRLLANGPKPTWYPGCKP